MSGALGQVQPLSKKNKSKVVTTLLRGPKLGPHGNSYNGKKGKILISSIAGSIVGNILAPGIGGLIFGGIVGGTLGASSEKVNKMAKIPVFYSFHFNGDVMRVQQVRNIGSIEGNSPTTLNEWERLKRSGDRAVKNWIDQNMKYKRCVVVLIGAETAARPWVKYEIEKAWNDGKALLGIYIH